MKKLFTALVSFLALFFIFTSAQAVYDVPTVSGDSNGDGRFTNLDLIVTCQYIDGVADWIHIDEADINGDGAITREDVILAANTKVTGRPNQPVSLTVEDNFAFADGGGVRFFAESPVSEAELTLYSAETGEAVTVLRDDGMAADDLPGDGIFTCRVDVTGETGDSLPFYAGGLECARSKNVSVSVRAPLMADSMAAADRIIQTTIFGAKDYAKLKAEQRMDLARTAIEDACGQGLIREDSVYYNAETSAVTFRYTGGAWGVVSVAGFGNNTNGGMIAAPAVSRAPAASTTKKVTPYLGRALILWSFGQNWDNAARKTYYTTLKKSWDSKGLVTTLNTDTTVSDYEDLSGYDLIVFSAHGLAELFKGEDEILNEYPMLLLAESVSADKDKLYGTDLADGRICRVNVSAGTKYAVLPAFIAAHGGDLENAVVISESCAFFGSVTYDTSMSRALTESGASAVIGWQGSVAAEYSRNVMNDVTLSLLGGKAVDESLTAAETKHKKLLGKRATATLIYDGGAVLGRTYNDYLSNGGFEADEFRQDWHTGGKVMPAPRIDIMAPPEGGTMAALFSGGELVQTMKLPEGTKRLSFFYDICNPQNQEQTGSKEIFTAEIITPAGTTSMLKASTVGAAIYGIDNTAADPIYHGGWEWCELDVSKYAGQTVTVRLAVSDEASAETGNFVLVDDITISTNDVKGASAAEMIDLARTQLDTTEWPFESNSVKYNTAYYGKDVFSEDGETYAWCCVFQWWLFRETGASELFYGGGKTASCRAAVEYAQRNKQWIDDKTAFIPGDIVFYNYNSEPTADHVGIFLRYNEDGKAVCIEGNTSMTDNDNGGRVMVRIRDDDDGIMGAFRPKYSEDGEVFDGR